jgi:hypothetical protein
MIFLEQQMKAVEFRRLIFFEVPSPSRTCLLSVSVSEPEPCFRGKGPGVKCDAISINIVLAILHVITAVMKSAEQV